MSFSIASGTISEKHQGPLPAIDLHSAERLQFILELSNDCYWEQDKDHRFTLLEYAGTDIPKQSLQMLIGKAHWDMDGIPVEDNDNWVIHKAKLEAREPFKDFIIWHPQWFGGEKFISISGQPVFEDGIFQGYRGLFRDITKVKIEEHFSSTVELAAIGISHVDTDGRFIHVNRQLCEMMGYSKEEFLKLTVKQISHPDDEDLTDEVRNKIHSGEIDSFNMEKRYICKDGSAIWVSLTIAVKRRPDGELSHDISVVEDISARKEAEDRVQYLATHDKMTNLPNRLLFSELLNHAIESSIRTKRKIAVLFIDLDRFKHINDSLGHEAGDILLIEMAKRLKQCLRASDVVARLGGDEFVVLLEDISDKSQVSVVARNILGAVIKPMEIMGQECRVTASVGVCMCPDNAEDEQSVMKKADIAMYLAKEKGKNNYQFYSDDIKSHSIEKLALEANVRRALEHNEFEIHYQAKVNVKKGKINGVEALLRWNNKELGLVSPAQFIPLTEEMGLIVPIGKWVLKTVCEQNLAWQKQGLTPVCISVNLSPSQFSDPELVPFIEKLLKTTGMAGELLELEVTENMVMYNTEKVIIKLKELKALGLKIAIDNFGTGYSTLSQLKNFPVDTLKVDRSFIGAIPTSEDDRAITKAIISMGNTLGLTVVAEGVETKEQQEFLSQNSCDEIQGFLISKPAVPEEFADLLREYNLSSRN